MVYFPERRLDGTWAAEKIFTKRIPHTVDFQIDGPEFELYREITRFVKRQSAKAAAQGDDPHARAVGFLMSLYQRRLASSAYAMQHSLENRARRLEDGLKRAQEIVRLAPPDIPEPEEVEEMEENERERLEEMLEAITLAGNAAQVREEIEELRGLARQADVVETSNTEAKLSKLKDLLHQQGTLAVQPTGRQSRRTVSNGSRPVIPSSRPFAGIPVTRLPRYSARAPVFIRFTMRRRHG